MKTNQIENKILEIYKKEKCINKVIGEVFKSSLSDDILENYNGFDPLDTVVNTVIKIIKEANNETKNTN